MSNSSSVVKSYGVHFFGMECAGDHAALTLPPSAISNFDGSVKEKDIDRKHRNLPYSRTHPRPSGWTISGQLHADWFVWVNDFDASHPHFGRVWGNFETQVHADSEEAFAHFYQHHQPEAWDYHDI